MEEQAVPGATCSSVNIDASLSISNLAAPLLAGFLFVLIGLRGIILIDTTLPAAYLAAGPLADYVFEPLMRPGGQLANRLPVLAVALD